MARDSRGYCTFGQRERNRLRHGIRDLYVIRGANECGPATEVAGPREGGSGGASGGRLGSGQFERDPEGVAQLGQVVGGQAALAADVVVDARVADAGRFGEPLGVQTATL